MAMEPMSQVGPTPQFPESDRQTYDAIEAVPRRNRLFERSGDRWAEEGLAFAPNVSGGFVGGTSYADSNAQSYETRIAGQAAGRLEPGATSPPPTWDAVDDRTKLAFMGGVGGAGGDGARAGGLPYRARPGANRNTITDVSSLTLGERPRHVVVAQVAPPGGGRGHRNVSDISDL